jgi:hypothetical protein
MNIHLPAILMFTRGTRVLTHPHNGINNTFPGDDTVLSPCCSCCGVWYHPQAGRDENRRVIPELYDVLQPLGFSPGVSQKPTGYPWFISKLP